MQKKLVEGALPEADRKTWKPEDVFLLVFEDTPNDQDLIVRMAKKRLSAIPATNIIVCPEITKDLPASLTDLPSTALKILILDGKMPGHTNAGAFLISQLPPESLSSTVLVYNSSEPEYNVTMQLTLAKVHQDHAPLFCLTMQKDLRFLQELSACLAKYIQG